MSLLFDDSYLLLGKDFKIDDNLIVKNPTVREIFDLGEEKYYSSIYPFISKPSDFKVELFDKGIDFESISDFDFFCDMVVNLKPENTKILFSDLDFSKMGFFDYDETQEFLFGDGTVFINDLTYRVMSDFIRKINGIPIKPPEKYLNEHVKQYRLEVERNAYKANQRKKKEPFKSMLIPIVSALVNHPGNPYDYKLVLDLTISQVHDALDRTQKFKNYDNIMMGLYTGSISSKDVNMRDVNWLA